MTIELLTLVALWCGSPLAVGISYQTSILRTHRQVDLCRAKMIACIETKAPIEECAKEAKLNE